MGEAEQQKRWTLQSLIG